MFQAAADGDIPTRAYGRLLLSPGAKAPVVVQSRGQIVCSCFNVTDVQIGEQLAGVNGDLAERLANLQVALKCGTSCGSCLPELKRRVLVKAPETV